VSGTEAPKRTKVNDVAMAEHRAWKQGLVAAQELTDSCVRVRSNLLALGFPAGHALCEEIDKDAAKWAGMANQIHRDMMAHAKENMIQV
jgi:hypothetical protein